MVTTDCSRSSLMHSGQGQSTAHDGACSGRSSFSSLGCSCGAVAHALAVCCSLAACTAALVMAYSVIAAVAAVAAVHRIMTAVCCRAPVILLLLLHMHVSGTLVIPAQQHVHRMHGHSRPP